ARLRRFARKARILCVGGLVWTTVRADAFPFLYACRSREHRNVPPCVPYATKFGSHRFPLMADAKLHRTFVNDLPARGEVANSFVPYATKFGSHRFPLMADAKLHRTFVNDLPARGEVANSFLRSRARKVWHHLAREQLQRCCGVSTPDHAEVDLQRGAFEAADAAVIAVDGAPNLLWSSDPSEAFFDLRLERLAREAFDHLLVVGVVARGHAGQPAGGRIYDRF